MSSRQNRGQIFSTDLLIALVVFILILGMFTTVRTFSKNRLEENMMGQELETICYTAADTLVKTPGHPVNWEDDPNSPATTSIGLVKTDRVLDEGKLMALKEMAPGRLRETLRTGGNNVSIAVKGLGGEVIVQVGDHVEGPSAIMSRRIVTYNGTIASLELTVGGYATNAGVLI